MEESGPRTPSEWSLTFHVNLRREKQSYKVNDFRTSTLRICDYTSDLDKVLRHLNTIPSVHEMVQGSISLFRDNIENIWEDPKNEGGTILRFMCCKKGEQEANKAQDENNDQERQDGEKRPSASTSNPKYASQRPQMYVPAIDVGKITDLWKLLCALVLSSAFEKNPSEQSNRAINGIYCKVAKEGIVTFEIWFSSYGGSNSKQKTINTVKNILTDMFNSPELMDRDSAADADGKAHGSSIASTFKVTELIFNSSNKHKTTMRSSMSH